MTCFGMHDDCEEEKAWINEHYPGVLSPIPSHHDINRFCDLPPQPFPAWEPITWVDEFTETDNVEIVLNGDLLPSNAVLQAILFNFNIAVRPSNDRQRHENGNYWRNIPLADWILEEGLESDRTGARALAERIYEQIKKLIFESNFLQEIKIAWIHYHDPEGRPLSYGYADIPTALASPVTFEDHRFTNGSHQLQKLNLYHVLLPKQGKFPSKFKAGITIDGFTQTANLEVDFNLELARPMRIYRLASAPSAPTHDTYDTDFPSLSGSSKLIPNIVSKVVARA
jgi:hypothetical protein